MYYYMSAPETIWKPVRLELLKDETPRNYLISFAGSTKHFKEFYQDGKNQIIIDSGAFSAWNSGKVIDFSEYLSFCKKLPKDVFKINLDVIPVTGSSKESKLKCSELSFQNYIKLSKEVDNVIPVHHYGEDISWARKMLQHTDYIAISPANDTSENVKRQYFDYIYSELPLNTKAHVLGYSSFSGCEIYPFYSVDSISYKKTHMNSQVYYRRNDNTVIDMKLKDYAKLMGFHYHPSLSLAKDMPELLTSATRETINNILNHFDKITENHKSKDFTFLKSQLKLF